MVTIPPASLCISNRRPALSYLQTDAPTPHIVGPTMLRPAVHHGKDTTHKTVETMCDKRACPQQVWKSCANGSNIVALRFGDHGTKEMLGVVGWKVWPVSNFAQQLPTTRNNMQQGVQTDATCKIQQCWEFLANNLASVCFIISFMIISSTIDHSAFCKPGTKVILNRPVWQ